MQLSLSCPTLGGSYPTPGFPAWTLGGEPVAFSRNFSGTQALIPVTGLKGPLLLECGGDDAVWPSCTSTDEIVRELGNGFPFPVTNLKYLDGGHGVGRVVPYVSFYEPFATTGRTAHANGVAREDAWPRLLAFLNTLEP